MTISLDDAALRERADVIAKSVGDPTTRDRNEPTLASVLYSSLIAIRDARDKEWAVVLESSQAAASALRDAARAEGYQEGLKAAKGTQ